MISRLSLQGRISAIAAATLVLALGLFSFLGVQSVRDSVDKTLDERLTMARIAASYLDEALTYIIVQLDNSAHFDGGAPTSEQFQASAGSLQGILARSRIYATGIFLLDRDGRIRQVAGGKAANVGTDMSVHPEVKETLATGRATVSGLVNSPVPDEPVVLISVPVSDGRGGITGALTASIDIERSTMSTLSTTIKVGSTGYTEIVDGNGIVLTRTSPGSPPRAFESSDHPARFAELISQAGATVGTCHRCHTDQGEVERYRDVLAFAPLSTASWGVAIRQSEEEALAPTRQLEQRFLLLSIIVLISVLLLVWTMTREIVSPIRMLTSAARKVTAGDFKTPIPVRRRDEIGQLGVAFHTMTQQLSKSRDELVSRNQELLALNSIVATVSQSLDLEEVLGSALQKVLDVTRTRAGHVFLRVGDSNELRTMKDVGSSPVFRCQEAALPTANCACHQVLTRGQTTMVNHTSQCPRLTAGPASGGGDDYFVGVPLKSKNRTLGIMNVADSTGHVFTESDFRLLDSIGYQVGLAIENSILYEETREKEKLRGQLLSSVISAQEEERKRVARELHDEFGQVMTGLMMSIESLESAVVPRPPQFQDKVEHARSLVEHALENLRRLTVDLRPSALDDLGLVAAVRAYAQRRLEEAGVRLVFDARGFRKRLEPAVETALFRILQEAIHNITKHAAARNVSIRLEAAGGKVTATVEDDGKGFDSEAKSRGGVPSLGLIGMRERAALLGGTLTVKSAAGRGTSIVVEIPVRGPETGGTASREEAGSASKA